MSLKYLTPQQVSDRYAGRISPRTLANWRSAGTGPRFLRLGGRILYALNDLAAWEARHTVSGTSEYRAD
uniref:Helix-turn-helix domain-containing protein n=1 Tax=Ralstonia solanacearum TaxID=305 RepID=A0A0S4UXE0_RALSL|nr:conserved protein of unknown function [Ralstonia solanacearum]